MFDPADSSHRHPANVCRGLSPSLLLMLLGVGACHRGGAPAQDTPSQQPSNMTEAGAAVPPGGGMTGVTKPLMQLLVDEKANRPTGTPSAEMIFAAVKQSGVATMDPSQVLGRTVGADFCENAHTDKGIVLSVCEFKDAESLAKGRAYSEKAFARALPNRSLFVNRKTLLTVNPPDASPATKDQVSAIARVFAGL